MHKNLMMVYNEIPALWIDVFNRDQSLSEHVTTIEEAKNYVNKYYSTMLGTFSFEESETELHTISELDISCINC